MEKPTKFITKIQSVKSNLHRTFIWHTLQKEINSQATCKLYYFATVCEIINLELLSS